ncbi:glycosyltransferase family 39 protein [Paenibacillus jiagnxiensis]|uniref:glycosyltransferase family 39 protein n=1 Tax=Paenibacillus jiagnxiensis TaxID=3228926 RepID=UPI00339F8585
MNKTWQSRMDIPLMLIMVLSAFLGGYNIWQDQYANTYYTTAVAAMLENWHNFFFASLDSAGSVSIDKPPVTFWIQTLSAYIFGLHGWSVILPQAFAQVGSVLLIYLLVKPTFGLAAARLSAFAMACTPVAVAVARTNNIDSMLVFTLLLAAWFLFRGIRKGKIASVIAAFAIIGVGFNMKMLQAYMVLPAFILIYVLAGKVNWRRKTAVLAGSAAALLLVSLSWPLIVDSTPADERPYVGSSGTNSVMNLAFGYNGVSRLTGDRSTGQSGGDGNMNRTGMIRQDQTSADTSSQSDDAGTDSSSMLQQNGAGSSTGDNSSGSVSNGSGSSGSSDSSGSSGDSGDSGDASGQMQMPSGGFGDNANGGPGGTGADSDGGMIGGPGSGMGGAPGGGSGGGMFGTGDPGPLRLFQKELSGQASWLLPFVALASVALLASFRWRSFTMKHKEILFWLAWLVPVVAFFSIAGFFHHYYLIMLAPPIAALFGAGSMEMWKLYRDREKRLGWLLPAAVLVTAVFAWYIMQAYNDTIGSYWSIGTLVLGIIGAVLLAVFRSGAPAKVKTALVISLLAVFIGPVYWAFTPIVYGGNSMIPQAGPSQSGFGMGGGSGSGGMTMREGRGFGENGSSNTGAAADSGNDVPDAPASNNRTDRGSGFQGSSMRGGGGPGGSESVDEKLLEYLRDHNTGEEYLFATMNYGTAAPYMIDEREKVIILNGFVQSDPVYDTAKLEALVKSGKVKYFLVSEGGQGGPGGGNSELTEWIQENGTEIPATEWQSSSDSADSNASQGGRSANLTLYEVTLQ